MMEGLLAPEHVKRITAGSMLKRFGLCATAGSRRRAAGDDLDGPTLARMFRAQARAAELLQKDALRDSGRSRQSQRAGSGAGIIVDREDPRAVRGSGCPE